MEVLIPSVIWVGLMGYLFYNLWHKSGGAYVNINYLILKSDILK